MIQLGHDERGSYAILDVSIGDGLDYVERADPQIIGRFTLHKSDEVVIDGLECTTLSPASVAACGWAYAEYLNTCLLHDPEAFPEIEDAILDQLREDRRENEIADAG